MFQLQPELATGAATEALWPAIVLVVTSVTLTTTHGRPFSTKVRVHVELQDMPKLSSVCAFTLLADYLEV